MDLHHIKSIFLGFGLVFSLCTGSAGSFTEQQALVLQSDDVRVKAGTSIPVSTVVRLKPQQEMRLLTTNGKTIKVKGAYTGAISNLLGESKASDSVNLVDLADAVMGRGQSRKALGAYRNLGQQSDGPRFQERVVRIVLGENSAYCIAPGQELALWRAESQSPLSLTLRAGKKKLAINWPGGAAETQLPHALLKAKPRRVIISGGELERSTRVRLWYGEAGDTPGEQLIWYNTRGCDVQFDSALTFYQTF